MDLHTTINNRLVLSLFALCMSGLMINLYGQSEIIDSLRNLANIETDDSLKFKHLYSLVREVEKTSPGNAIEVSRELYSLAIKRNDLKNLGQAAQLLGRFFLATDQNDSALHYLFLSNDHFSTTADSLSQLIRNNSNIALIYQRTNQYEQAAEMYISVIEKAIASENFYSAAVASVNQASLLMAQELDERAIPYLLSVYDYYELADRTNTAVMNRFKNLMPNVYINLGQAYQVLSEKNAGMADYQDTAIIYFEKTIEEAKNINNAFNSAYLSSYAYNSLGNLRKAQADQGASQSMDGGRTLYRDAAKQYIMALEGFEAINDKRGFVFTSNNLGNIYSKLNEPQRALQYYQKALAYAEEIQFIEEQQAIYNNLADNYKILGDYESAFFSLKRHVILNDSLKNAERNATLQELDTRYKTAEKDKEIAELALLNAEKERKQQQQLIYFLVGIGTLIFVGALSWSRYRYLAQKKKALYEKEINTAMSRFVPQEFLSAIGRDHILDVQLGDNRENNVTILFTDIRGYTTRTESSTPAQIFQFVKEYMGMVGPIIRKNNGIINQYLGDGIMAIFQHSPEDALKACIEMQAEINNYNHNLLERNETPIKVGMGIHSGPLIMGIIGDETRRDATVISDSVNTSARIESITKEYGADILLSLEALNKIENRHQFHFRCLGKASVKGKDTQIELYECYDIDPPESIMSKSESRKEFDKGLEALNQQDYHNARHIFLEILGRNPHDRVAQHFIDVAEIQSKNHVLT